jgi:branched-chain amino acid transport system permease protein
MLLSSVFVGCVYGLVAVGYTILFRAGGILNFAQATLMVLAAFAMAELATSGGLDAVVPALVVVLATGAMSVLIYTIFLRRLTGLDPLGLTILTMGVAIVLQGLANLRWGADILNIDLFDNDRTVHVPTLGSATLTQLATVGITLAVFAALAVFFRFTRVGLQLRAASEAPALAARNGINVAGIYSVAWIIAGFVAGIGGVFYGASSSVSASIADVGLAAFPAAVVGGLGSIPGALLGGLTIGLAQQATSYYWSATLADVSSYVLMLLILMVRPAGLLGRPQLVRS